MKVPAELLPLSHGSTPGRLVAVALALLLGLVGAYAVNLWAGLAILALGLVVIARPLDPFVAVLLVAGVAAFAEYGDPHIQRDLAIVLLLTFYALASLVVSSVSRRWALPVSRFTVALLALAVTTGVAVLHGLAVRNPFRFLSLELFPLFALSFSFVVGGLRLRPGDLRIAEWTLGAVGVAASSIGFYHLATTGTRTQGLPFSPVPGFIALVVLALALFDPEPRPRLAPALLFCLLVFHQIVTFTRGFWLGLLVGVPFTCAIYLFHGPGARRRWPKVLRTLGLVGLVLALVVALASTWLGWSETIGMLGARFASSFATKNSAETVSNVVRLIEFRTALNLILSSPILGYGHGSTLVVKQFLSEQSGPQWWVHESYVMIWLKQGILGLAALLWLLFSAARLGVKGASHPTPQIAGWCAASAACTVFAAITGLTSYGFFAVNQSFLLAVLWGVALAAGEPERRRLVWRASRAGAVAGPDGGEEAST